LAWWRKTTVISGVTISSYAYGKHADINRRRGQTRNCESAAVRMISTSSALDRKLSTAKLLCIRTEEDIC
jgi:hypothetical protein